MGEGLLRFYRERLRESWKIAFFSALAVGLIAHFFKFTNYLPNHDALYFTYGTLDYPPNGRWLLPLACMLSSYYDLPWLNGLLSLCWIGLTAAVITDVFGLRGRFACFLTGALLVSFPVVTNTFFFEFTADGYMLAMLLAALGVRFSLVGERRPWALPAAMLCICLSCGIYQAYISFALLLSVCHFMQELLTEAHSARERGAWIGRQFLVYGGGLLLFWLVWQLILRLRGLTVSAYQGIDQLGHVGPQALLHALRESAATLARFFLGGNVFRYGWSLYAVLNLVFLLFLAAMLLYAAGKTQLWRRAGSVALLLLCLLLLPLFAFIWAFLSPGVGYHMLMLQSLCVPYLFGVALCDRFGTPRVSSLATVLFLALVLKFTVQANICYYEMEQCMRRTEATATEMLTRIHELDDGSVRRIAFLEGGDQSLIVSSYTPALREITVHAHQLRENLLFDNNYAGLYMRQIMGVDYKSVDEEELRALEESEETKGMAVWPARDSLRLVGDTAVIRLPVPERLY